jgi:hypothetical protein
MKYSKKEKQQKKKKKKEISIDNVWTLEVNMYV